MIGTIADHLQVPWGIAILSDGSALVTERDSGRVLKVTVARWTTVGHRRRGGSRRARADCSAWPCRRRTPEDGRVFFYASTSDDNRVLRTTYRNGKLGPLVPILTGIPNSLQPRRRPDDLRAGRAALRLTGDSGNPHTRRTPVRWAARSCGSAGRRPAPGNPDSIRHLDLGHRNVQGLAFDDKGKLWASEFGRTPLMSST